jgi:hypothetical protein
LVLQIEADAFFVQIHDLILICFCRWESDPDSVYPVICEALQGSSKLNPALFQAACIALNLNPTGTAIVEQALKWPAQDVAKSIEAALVDDDDEKKGGDAKKKNKKKK